MQGYFAVVEKEPASDFGVFFPDLPGCVTAGSDFAEAVAWAHEALTLHVEDMTPEELPPASSLAQLEASDLYQLARDNVVAVIRIVPSQAPLAEAAE